MKVAAGEFKAKCLKMMDNVQENRREIIITKFGKPIAKLVSVEKEEVKPLFGILKDSLFITGDIVNPTGEKWNADD